MPPFPTPAHHSLEAVPADSKIRGIYPRDFFPNPKTVRLPLGKTAYWLLGPEDGTKVVLIHGISTPCLLWRNIAPFLADNGFRVLIYDLFGRGYSEAPKTTYDADLYMTQLALLMQHVRFTDAHIVGLSMGGGIAATFAATFPDLVTEKVIFVASAGLMDVPANLSQLTPEAVAAAGINIPDDASFMLQFRKLQTEALPGYAYALTSSIKEGPLREMDSAFMTISETPRLRCLIIHGTNDGTVSFKFGEKIKALLPAAEFLPIEGADHDLIIAEGYYEQVRTGILKFLQS